MSYWFETPYTLVCSQEGLRLAETPQRPGQLPARFRAVSTQSIKAGASNGLARKQMAPALKAEARTLSSGKAVIKITGAT